MSLLEYSRFAAALAFVLGLIGVLYFLARRYGAQRFGIGVGRAGLNNRLSVVEVRILDGRHRLVLIRRDAVEHLLLMGPETTLVVESGIRARLSFEDALERTDDSEAVP